MRISREKIILTIAALASLYLLFDLVIAPMIWKKTSSVETEKIDNEKLMTEMAELGKKDGSMDTLIYTISRVDAKWPSDPFLVENLAAANAIEMQKSKYVYSGFVSLGSKKMAIINGFEYQVGDKLATDNFYVVGISGNAVILEDMISKSRISIPVEE